MLSRRKFFALIAGALAAPKVLLAAPKTTIPGEVMFMTGSADPGTLYWSKPPGNPEVFDRFYYDYGAVFLPLSPRRNFKITGITTPDEETNGHQGKARSARL